MTQSKTMDVGIQRLRSVLKRCFSLFVVWSFLCFSFSGFWAQVRFRSLIIHHTADRTGNLQTIRFAHLKRGWWEAAYHLILSPDGSGGYRLEPTWRYRLMTWSAATPVAKHNVEGLHIAVVGNFEEDIPDPEVLESLAGVLEAVRYRHGLKVEDYLLHRECSATLCPGQFINRAGLAELHALAPRKEAYRRATLQFFFLPSLVWLFGSLILINRFLRLRKRVRQHSNPRTLNSPVPSPKEKPPFHEPSDPLPDRSFVAGSKGNPPYLGVSRCEPNPIPTYPK